MSCSTIQCNLPLLMLNKEYARQGFRNKAHHVLAAIGTESVKLR